MNIVVRVSWAFIFIVLPFSVMGEDVDTCRQLEAEEFYIRLQSSDFRLILDTRTFEEFRRERLPGAVLAESRAALEKLADTLDFDRELFVYCEDNNRSLLACRILLEKGFRNVYDLRGGIIAWKKASYELDKRKIRRKNTEN